MSCFVYRFKGIRLLLIFGFMISGFNAHAQTFIHTGQRISRIEANAVKELQDDLVSVQIENIELIAGDVLPDSDLILVVGQSGSNKLAESLLPSSHLPAETFRIKTTVVSGQNALVISGADERGLFYGIYYFSEQVLGIDPFSYWTGKEPEAFTNYDIPSIDYTREAPLFPLRGYFDNDSDQLANFKGQKLIIELDLWKEMINSLARVGYNYIDLFDTLGRPEFYLRDYYKKNFPGFKSDMKLIEGVIDYAHSRGMMVQIPMYLGFQFYPLDDRKVNLAFHYDEWLRIYRYYMNETPLGKGDLFLIRPRHPIWDHAYPYANAKKYMSRMADDTFKIIKERNPDAMLICDLWQEGRELWNAGHYDPPKETVMLWADYGHANFRGWMKERKGHPFGIYLHAGVWKNNVVQDPYPELIKKALVEARDNEMTQNIFVNGQSFKPFILNLEASAKAAWNPDEFDPDHFYREWAQRYFGEEAAALTVKSMKMLSAAHRNKQEYPGYRNITLMTNLALKMRLKTIKSQDAFLSALTEARMALSLAEEARSFVEETDLYLFDDQVLFPIKIYTSNLELFASACTYVHQPSVENTEKLALRYLDHINLLRNGSGWSKWDNWYKPENFRCHTPHLSIDELPLKVRKAVKKLEQNK